MFKLTGCEGDFPAGFDYLEETLLYKEVQFKVLPACENQSPNPAEPIINENPGCSCYSFPSLLKTVGALLFTLYQPQLWDLTGEFSFQLYLLFLIHFAAQNMASMNQTVVLTKSQCLGDMMV